MVTRYSIYMFIWQNETQNTIIHNAKHEHCIWKLKTKSLESHRESNGLSNVTQVKCEGKEFFFNFPFRQNSTARKFHSLYLNNNNTNTIIYRMSHYKFRTVFVHVEMWMVACTTVDNKPFQWNNLNENKTHMTITLTNSYTHTDVHTNTRTRAQLTHSANQATNECFECVLCLYFLFLSYQNLLLLFFHPVKFKP